MRKSLTLSLAAVALVSATSCNEQLDVIATTSTEATYQDKLAEFAANFEKEFGTPDPNHTWGFGMTPEEADAILGVTRAAGDPDASDYNAAGRLNVNRNMWCTASDPTSLLNIYGVPGWPNWDGKYYTQDGTYSNGHYPIYDTKQPSCNMPGDVTEFEILWVSNQVHYQTTYPTVDLHLSDYYIQVISTNGDYANDADYRTGTVITYGGIGTNGNNYEYSNYAMDYLNAKSLGGTNTWTHINNFNANMNDKPNLHVGNNSCRNIIYVQSAGTEDFNYHPSNATQSATFDEYILVRYEWDEPLDPEWSTKIPTGVTIDQVLAKPTDYFTCKKREGFYLCFDFQCTKTDEGWPMYEGDGVYDNWILKLTPGYPVQKDRWPKRLMCEDLGNTFDFDFNDAVFDLSFAQNVADQSGQTYDMVVVIQAAGGTMPIYVALDPDGLGANMEIHHLLGDNPSTTPVNVIKGGAKAPAAMYRYKNAFKVDPSKVTMQDVKDTEGNVVGHVPSNWQNATLLGQMAASAFKMKIYIINGSTKYAVSGYDLYQGMRATDGTGYNGGVRATNAVPQLFNCSTDAKWTYENGHIKDAYQHFADWVADEQCDYRLRWDEKGYFKRDGEGQLPIIENHSDTKVSSWLGSWDFGSKESSVWGNAWIDKSKCYGAE